MPPKHQLSSTYVPIKTKQTQEMRKEPLQPITGQPFSSLKNGARSVGTDMAPGCGSDGQRGKIILTSNDFAHTEDAIKTISFRITGTSTTTVQTFIGLINEK